MSATSKWSRLKPVQQDPLENVGLPSKGDRTLLDFKAQEDYFGHIRSAHRRFLQNTATPNDLSHSDDDLSQGLERIRLTNSNSKPASAPALPERRTQAPPPPPSKDTLLFSMRKLRESLIATHRADEFALEVYLFIIRFAILQREPESYHPSILSLLWNRELSSGPVREMARKEVAGWLILDLACRQEDMASAWDTYFDYIGVMVRGDGGEVIGTVLRCLVSDDWYAFWTLKAKLDRYQSALVGFADGRMKKLAVGCLRKAYLKIDMGFVHRATGSLWKVLKQEEVVGWEEEGDVLIVRKTKGK